MSVVMSYSCLTYKEPVLSLKLSTFSISIALIGFTFSIDTVTYIIASFAMNFYPESKKNFLKIMLAGVFIFIVSMLLLGPAPFLPK